MKDIEDSRGGEDSGTRDNREKNRDGESSVL